MTKKEFSSSQKKKKMFLISGHINNGNLFYLIYDQYNDLSKCACDDRTKKKLSKLFINECDFFLNTSLFVYSLQQLFSSSTVTNPNKRELESLSTPSNGNAHGGTTQPGIRGL